MSQDLLAAFGDFSTPTQTPSPCIEPGQSHASFEASSYQQPNVLNTLHPQGIPSQATNTTARDQSGQADFDDDWGDFEGNSEAPQQKAAPQPVATQFSRWLDEEDDGFKDYNATSKPSQRPVKWDFTKPDAAPSILNFQSNNLPATQTRDPNVLFDAEDEPSEEEEDDFGDFEDADKPEPVSFPAQKQQHVSISQPIQPRSNLVDLLGMDDMSATPSMTPVSGMGQSLQAHVTATNRPADSLLDLEDLSLANERTNVWGSTPPPYLVPDPFSASAHTEHDQPKSSQPSLPVSRLQQDFGIEEAKAAPPSSRSQPRKITSDPKPKSKPEVKSEPDEQWDDFDAWTPSLEDSAATTKPSLVPTIPQSLTSDVDQDPAASPPTNIPPPALVLTLFPPLFSTAETSFFAPLRKVTPDVQQAVYSDKAAATYLKGLLALATVCGRVIAGRKLRWKRDTILAQSMRIGPAGTGGHSGLKLTSIDKAENAKEEREAADVLKAWQAQVGKVKNVLAEVKRCTAVELGKIPELSAAMPVRTAKEIEGGLKGNRPCALCGLKREERVAKVDFDVEDSFGEWWVDNMSMHRACRNFWEQHKDTLRHH